jgi:hypothetical protein
MHLRQFDTAIIMHPAAHVDGGRMRPFRRANAFAPQVFHRLDAGVLVHIEGREAEKSGTDNRQTNDIGILAGDLRRKFGKAQFGNIPLPICREAREHLMVRQYRPGMLYPLGPHITGAEITEMIVIGRRNTQFYWFHDSPKTSCFVPNRLNRPV